MVGAYSMVVMTAKTGLEAPGRDPALGEANRGRCGGTCGWRQTRNQSDRRWEGRGAGGGGGGVRTLALTWGSPARPQCPASGATSYPGGLLRAHSPLPIRVPWVTPLLPMDSGVLLVRATLAPGIGVNSLGAGFSCSSKGSRFRWRDRQTRSGLGGGCTMGHKGGRRNGERRF